MNVIKDSKLAKEVISNRQMVKKNQQIVRKAEIKTKAQNVGNTKSVKVKKNQQIVRKADVSKYYVTGETLLNMNIKEQDFLIEGIIPRTGVVGLGGSSDTGKSSFLRQLAVHITTGKDEFLDFKLKPKYNNVIYLSTEDDEYSISNLLQKQNEENNKSELFKGLRYMFDSYKILEKLEAMLIDHPADCIIIDTFTDFFDGDMNSTNKVRSFINNFVNVAKRYECLIIFLHHTTKNSDKNAPSKHNFNGSQGFEAKMRLLIELRKDQTDKHKRHMCIVKGNYLSENLKEKSYVLHFSENQIFTMTTKRVSFELLGRNERLINQKLDRDQRIKELMNKKLSIREISDTMKSEGFQVEKSTVENVIKNFKKSNPSENSEEVQIEKTSIE
jgi:RecA-family ATPase